jgi:ligand-binding sensor domain-containing protein
MVRGRARSIAKVAGLSRTAISLLLLLGGFTGRALALDPNQPFSSYLRTHFTNEDGLTSSVVHNIVQSQDGFLWLASGANILTRFDGHHFMNMTRPGSRLLAIARTDLSDREGKTANVPTGNRSS